MRLFLGIQAVIPAYDDLVNELSPFFEGKWVEPENLHLTLLFLGEVADEKPIIAALKGLTIPKVPIVFQALDLFRGQILVINAYPQDPIRHIHDELKSRLSFLTIEDDKLFHPHVTIARIKQVKSRKIFAMTKLTRETVYAQVDNWKVCLIQSDLSGDAPVYRVIKSF